jgi:Uma2 family endonuclease
MVPCPPLADDGIVVGMGRETTPMAPAPATMTVDEYFRTPERLAPAELVFGVLRLADSPAPRHQSAVAKLYLALQAHVRKRRLGTVWLSPLDVVLDDYRALIVQPDLLFISKAREWIVRDRVRGAPDLVVEVLSPHPRIGRTEERIGWFAEYGVCECWLVHQDRADVTVMEFGDGRVREERVSRLHDPIRSRVLSGFSLSLHDILTR